MPGKAPRSSRPSPVPTATIPSVSRSRPGSASPGAAIAAWILLQSIPGGWAGALPGLEAAGKLTVLDFGWSWERPYTFWAGILGGALLTMATHGTDQMFVQRLLAGA